MKHTIEKTIEEKMENLIKQSLETILEKNIESILDIKLDSYLGKKLDEKLGQHSEHAAKEWLNVQETCDYIGISYKNLQKLINQGLKGNSIGRSKRFSKTEINNFLKNVQA